MNEAKSKTVLVLEDEEALRKLTSVMLDRAGYRTVLAENADEGRALWQKEGASIDLLIADIILPGASGYELAAEFRRARPDLKILFVSGNPKDALMETSHVIKGSKFLLKPVPMKTLLEFVRDMIG